jgi:hydrogenase maturation protein HypF
MLIEMIKAIKIIVGGLVQGVGFRPAIRRAALYSNIKGYVKNLGGSEVEIFIEGDEESIETFINSLVRFLPPHALIEEVHMNYEKPRNLNEFAIEKSSGVLVKRSMIPPDLGICEYCLREVLDPSNKRHRYPFNSCAWCGPRYSMMFSIPYDRENTSMRKYKLCNDCLKEYEDINDIRRHHAQGISCPDDGPRLYLCTSSGERLDMDDPVREAAKLIDEGFIVAVKGIGGYHIACLATDDNVVVKLRERKKRPSKPFAVMALDLDVVSRLVYLTPPSSIDLLLSPQRPIVLLPKREDSPVSYYVSPGMDVEGVFLPYTALHYLLLQEVRDKVLIMTSGNVHGQPMCRTEECVFKKLSSVVDYVLAHDREIVNRVDDSVIRFTNGEAVFLRRGRGYAPMWIRTPFHLDREVIAMGAELQTAAGIGFEDKVVLTPYVGDLDSAEAVEELEEMLRFLMRSYGVDWSRSVVVVDKHPKYISRELAYEICEKHGCRVIEVQHHYAHILSTLADRKIRIESGVMGIAIDGTGYGDDGSLWGGEVMVVKPEGYVRVGSLEAFPITSERDITHPTRLLIALLARALGFNVYEIAKEVARGSHLSEAEMELVIRSVHKGQYIEASSVGRFLDAVAALLGVCYYRSYEGEPAIKLEATARKGRLIDELGQIGVHHRDVYRVGVLNYIARLAYSTLQCNSSSTTTYNPHDIAFTVQIAIGRALAEIVLKSLYGMRNIEQFVVIGGGAAVNNLIVRGIAEVLSKADVKVYLPKKVPPNDGGIALGQIYAYYMSSAL